MLRKLCEYKQIEILEAEACKDHIHMLISVPPKYSISQIMGYLTASMRETVPFRLLMTASSTIVS